MLLIKNISKDIKASLSDAEKYLGRAMSVYMDYPKLADVYYSIMNDHKKEVDLLHTQVVDIIKTTKSGGIKAEILAVMEKLWEFEHDELLERMDLLNQKEQRYMNLRKR